MTSTGYLARIVRRRDESFDPVRPGCPRRSSNPQDRSISGPDAVARTTRGEVMWWGMGILGFIIWVAIAFWPARVAGRKGHSFVGYFLLSLLFFPLSLV